MVGLQKYLYCIILAERQLIFDIPGMAGADRVYTVNYKDLAVVVSDSFKDRFSISRENLLTHQQVLEHVMQKFTLLPVKFGTQSKSEESIQEILLKKRYKELKQTLNYFNGKNQMCLKVLWADMSEVYQELTEANHEIKKLRDAAATGKVSSRNELIEVGQYIQQEFISKAQAERDRIVKSLKKYAVKIKLNYNYGDEMFVNANFLIDQEQQELFDSQVSQLASFYSHRAYFKYIGPIPPYDFVQIHVD